MATENKDDIIIAMLEEIKSGMKNQKQSQIDLSKVEQLSGRLEETIHATADTVARLAEIIEVAHQPVIHQRRITIDIVSKEVVFLFVGMVIIIAGLRSWLYFATRPDYDRIDNDLKYRYILMKGEASPGRISELENIFEINRDNAKIRQMKKDVKDYERIVKTKVALDEQNRLRKLEADKLSKRVNSIKISDL